MSLEWMNDALCAQVGTEIFFPERGGNPREALQVCKACTVRDDCLNHALELKATSPLNVTGIWGGTTERQRHKIGRTKGAA